MQKNGKWMKDVLPDDGILRYLRFAILPLVVIILIIVIVRADSQTDKRNQETVSSAAAETQQPESPAENAGEDRQTVPGETSGENEETGEENEETGGEDGEPSGDESAGDGTSGQEQSVGSESADSLDISQYTLKQDEIPELLYLVQTYCQAKEDCDPQLMASVFGNENLTEEAAEAEKEKMELVKASIKSYENISCYSIEGPEPDSYVIFPYFEICYREAEVLMPELTWAYAVLGEDGQYRMTQDVSQETAEYLSRIGEKEDVKALIAQVKAAKQEAIAADEKLQSIYGAAGGSEVSIGQTVQP